MNDSDYEDADGESIGSECEDNIPELHDHEDDELSAHDSDNEEHSAHDDEYIAKNGNFSICNT